MSETTDQITEAQLAATIDHAILKPELTRTDVDAELDIAAEWKVFSVCVRPSDILVLIDSYGQVALAVNSGSAAEVLGLSAGDRVRLRRMSA